MAQEWKIYWNEYMADCYIYGSEVRFLARDDVYFQNALMPSGTVIKRWYSKVNYQAKRVEPSLPMIDGENRYRITADITTDEPAAGEGYLLRVVFYDRYEVEAGDVIVRGGSREFRCPLKTYSYEVQLIGAGTKGFHFHSMTITELSDGEQISEEKTE